MSILCLVSTHRYWLVFTNLKPTGFEDHQTINDSNIILSDLVCYIQTKGSVFIVNISLFFVHEDDVCLEQFHVNSKKNIFTPYFSTYFSKKGAKDLNRRCERKNYDLQLVVNPCVSFLKTGLGWHTNFCCVRIIWKS